MIGSGIQHFSIKVEGSFLGLVFRFVFLGGVYRHHHLL
ncbi:hypothetical protein JOC54_002190 [Alkalihalobacillus xiaoxiensis]|uniref:Uncharacterized protein n=1 Tax=Shouchella xiaoxiensis TaxID=766895 RepID=A0ABS2SVT4_9BACI|nr:hypothetical protein [Shouchella xiaoxiensis]